MSEGSNGAPLVRAALPLLVRLPFVRAEMARTNQLFMHGVTDVTLSV